MITACQARYPTVAFATGDARDLSRFPAASFEFILFSQNGIDCIDHSGRLQALAEIRRILAPCGVFIFSSRNRHFKFRGPWGIRRLLQPSPFASPSRLFDALRTYAAGIYHFLRHRPQEEQGQEYAIATSDLSNYNTLLYAISIDAQLAQLRRVGFCEAAVVAYNNPRVLRPDEYAGCDDPWFYYVCGSVARLIHSS
jgi:SAM-dependent methyltransferase